MGAQQKLQSSKSMPLEVSGHSVCADLEALLRRLRRWGSWYRFSGEELPLLESLKTSFRHLLNALARLREELDCLDDGSTALPLSLAVEEMAPLLLVASQVQAAASGWCQALASFDGLELRSLPTSDEVSILDAEKLADFIEEALGAEASLERQLRRFGQLRREAVERAKASIEAGPTLDFQPEEEQEALH